MMECFFFWES